MIAGLVVNKNLKKGAKVHEKVSAGGRRQLFVPTRSEMIEEEDVGETVTSKLQFVKALRSIEKPRDFLAKLGSNFLAEDGEESNFEKDFLVASVKLAERKPDYGKRKLLNHSLLFTMFLLVKRECEESTDEIAKQLFWDIFKSENAFFEAVIAEMDRSDEVEELFKAEEVPRVNRRKKSVKDEREVSLDDGVEELCKLFENDTAVEKSKVVKIFEEKSKVLTLAVRMPILKKRMENEGRTMIKFKKDDFTRDGKQFTREDSVKASGARGLYSAQKLMF